MLPKPKQFEKQETQVSKVTEAPILALSEKEKNGTVSDDVNNLFPKAEDILSCAYDNKPTENTDNDIVNKLTKILEKGKTTKELQLFHREKTKEFTKQ